MRQRDDSACTGLGSGQALARTGRAVRACEAARSDGPFSCPECHAPAILRQGAHRVDHFAHQGAGREPVGPLEGALHRHCKRQVCAALAARDREGSWQVERVIPDRPAQGIPELRPDISGRVRGCPVALEVQASALPIEAILARTLAYAQRRIHVLWLVPLPEEPIEPLIRPRLHERYFHSMYFGRTYYWWPGLGTSVLPVHYGAAKREVARSDWYEAGGFLRRSGGFQVDSKANKVLQLGPVLDIVRDFGPLHRGAFTPANERKAVPACRLWFDGLQPWW